MTGQLKLKVLLIPGPHMLEIMHPFDDVPLAAVFNHFEEVIIDRELILRFPYNSRFFLDGEDLGRIIDAFEEVA
jgi:hypothetical protein